MKIINEKPRFEKSEIEEILRKLPHEEALKKLVNDLTGRDLKGIDLHGVDLTGFLLENIDFTDANLSGVKILNGQMGHMNTDEFTPDIKNCNFKNADLTWIKMTSLCISGCSFEKAKMISAQLTHIDFNFCDFQDANLSGNKARFVSYHGSNIFNTALNDSDMLEVNFKDTSITDSCFDYSSLKHIYMNFISVLNSAFAYADFDRCRFIGADISKVKFIGSKFTECDFDKAKIDTASVFREAVFKDVRITAPCENTELMQKLTVTPKEEDTQLPNDNTGSNCCNCAPQ
jgi:uncharacterized protein YjbI with pentapeptide repeats